MSAQIAAIEPCKNNEFKERLNQVIKLYPGNSSKKDKTINNWRTEISSLFGLIEYENDLAKPGGMAISLSKNQDLISFFRYFLFHFQYPGGHLKPHESMELIKEGIKFKPAKYILQVLLEGEKILDGTKSFGLSKAEVTHCIFNDLRVTRDHRSPKETAEQILENRRLSVEYETDGDVIRYAGDILDYMELADLLKFKPNYQYYLNATPLNVIDAFNKDDKYFPNYNTLYNKAELSVEEISSTQQAWFSYVNTTLDSSIFNADTLSILEEFRETSEEQDLEKSRLIMEIITKLRNSKEKGQTLKTNEIGNIGETLVIEHEKARLTALERKDLLHLIKKIPETFAVGYDISSYEGLADLRRYIEVKATVSRGKLSSRFFHMTPSEWSAANSNRNIYFIYRLMISAEDISLFVIKDPVGKYKEDLLDMVVREGADVSYSDKSGNWEPLLA
jgi:hypothetical protein